MSDTNPSTPHETTDPASKVSVDPARVLQRLLTGDRVGALYAQMAMRDIALEDAYQRIAELQPPADPVVPPGRAPRKRTARTGSSAPPAP